MNRATEKLAEQFHLAAILAQRPIRRPRGNGLHMQASAWDCALDAAELTRIGRELVSIGVARCNYGDTPRREKRSDKLEARAQEIAIRYELVVEAGGDPRGYVLRLHGKGLPRNNMGEGFGVA